MHALRVILELGTARRVVAGATDWPGLDRWGRSETDALAKLSLYLPRYAGVAARAGLAEAFAQQGEPDVIERVPGTSSTDFWGIAHVPSISESQVLPVADLERRLDLLRAGWAVFDDTAARVSAELRPGARSEGRSRDAIVGHVHVSELRNWSPKVGVRSELEALLTPDGLADHRARFVDAIRVHHADGRPARRWPIAFLIRRTAQHVMDHAWELEDRDLA